MFNSDLKISSKAAKSNKLFVESLINNFEEANTPEAISEGEFLSAEGTMVLENMDARNSILNKYRSFTNTMRNTLLIEAMCKIMNESVTEEVRNDRVSRNIMRAMVSEYVNENGYDNILHRMKTASISTSMLYNTISTTASKILESVDKSDPNTFVITPEMKDDFFKQLDYSDTEAISDAIKERVADAMNDFVTANTKDHDDITSALNAAQEKINSSNPDDTELHESYTRLAKSKVNDIRNRSKGVFHSMVEATCKSVLANKDMQEEFMTEGHLDMNKIVDRTKLMYTFIEMLNTSRIAKVDASFLEGVISDLTKA